MKCFTATWMTAVASAVLLTLPTAGAAQTPPTSTPPATAQPPATAPTSPTAQSKTTATGDQAAAQEHLRKASAALDAVNTATLPAKAKSQVADIKRRLTALERTTAAGDKASATGQANRSAKAKSGADWGTEVAAIDKALTTLLGPTDTTGAAPTGTAGTTAPAGNKAAAAIDLDAEARASLTEVRTHLTAFATAMAGGKTGTETTEPTAATDPSAPAATTSSATQASAAQPPATQPPATDPPAAQPPTTQPPTTSPTQQPTDPSAPAAATSTPQASDQEAARKHLTEARNTLSALTQLPAAAQLSGEARTHVAQLISNFNELITTQSQWRESYTKVSANLASLIGPETGATTPPSASGTAGAVGTSGTATAEIDPAVREKLVELRRHLSAFEKAAGGSAAGAATATASAPPDTSTPPDTKPPVTSSPTSPATPPASGTPPAAATPTTPATEAEAGTTSASNPDVARHLSAIEALLKMQDDSGGLTLTKAQVEELRTHWAALRQILNKK